MVHVETRVEGRIGTIVLAQAAKLNALSQPVVQEVIDALADFQRQRLRVVVLCAAPGMRVFSAGHDVGELPLGGRDPLGWDDPLQHLIREIENYPAPVIAMVEGGVWGGACEAVFACDQIVAAPGATFAITPPKLGVPYNISAMRTFLNAASPRIGKDMAFTARPIPAGRLERLGMINHLVPSEERAGFVQAMAADIARNAPLGIAVMKEQLRILAGAKPMSPQGFERIQGLRRVFYMAPTTPRASARSRNGARRSAPGVSRAGRLR